MTDHDDDRIDTTTALVLTTGAGALMWVAIYAIVEGLLVLFL